VNQSPDQSQKPTSADFELSTTQRLSMESLPDSGSLGSLFQFIKKRGWLIILGAIVGLAAAETLDVVVKRYYSSTAQIEIVPDMSPQFRLEQIQSMMGGGSGDDSEKLDTEIQILQSPTLELDTIQALHLNTNPTFLPYKYGRPWNLSSPLERETIIKQFNNDVDVKRWQHTDIIQVKMTTGDPALSSLIANTLIDKYIERSFHANYESTVRVSGWLNQQLNDLRNNLEKSQQQMIAYQRDLGLVGLTVFSRQGGSDTSGSTDIMVASLDEMIKQSADASVDRMMKEALYNSIQTATPDVVDATAALSDPELLVSKETLLGLQNDYASMSKTYGKAYPPLQALQKQMNDLQAKIDQEEHAAVASAKTQFQAATQNESMVRKNLDSQEQEVFGKGEQMAKFEFALEDYESNRLLYDGLQERLQEAGILSGLHSTSIQQVDDADIPARPSFPRAIMNLPIGAGVGLLIGFGLALVIEGMDVNLKTISEVEQGLGFPLLAAIPAVKTQEIGPENFADHATMASGALWSRIAEALREMRTSILLSSPGSPPKVIMIASSRPSEGKSSVATLFAITLALAGSKVLVIDADLRRSSVHLRFHIGRQTGLSSALTGKTTLKESIVEWPKMPNLHIMAAGPTPPLPSELLGSKQMEDMIAILRREYDFIILDTPPVLVVTDAQLISRVADAVVLLVRYGTVQRHVAQRSIDLLERSGAHFLGIAINAVDLKAPEYSEYYGRKYSDYYGEPRKDQE
jgi:succinoglycan biosynthesis transport protein ExoP